MLVRLVLLVSPQFGIDSNCVDTPQFGIDSNCVSTSQFGKFKKNRKKVLGESYESKTFSKAYVR